MPVITMLVVCIHVHVYAGDIIDKQVQNKQALNTFSLLTKSAGRVFMVELGGTFSITYQLWPEDKDPKRCGTE